MKYVKIGGVAALFLAITFVLGLAVNATIDRAYHQVACNFSAHPPKDCGQ